MKHFVITTKDSKRKITNFLPITKIVYAVEDKQPHISLYKTVLKILKENQNEIIMISEDDVLFTENFSMQKLENIIEKYKHSFDTILTGALISFFEYQVREVFDEGISLKDFKGTQNVVYMPSCYQKLKDKPKGHIDINLSMYCNNFCVFPFMSYQKSDEFSKISRFSDMENRFKGTEYYIKENLK